jgi:hypothetical protein
MLAMTKVNPRRVMALGATVRGKRSTTWDHQ